VVNPDFMKKQKLCEGCDQCNSKSPLFQLLSEEELQIINKDRFSVRFHPGEVILKQGTLANHLISVVEGFASMYIEGYNDRRLLLDFIKPWHLVGSPGVHSEGKHSYSVVAIRETMVCYLDIGNINAVIGMNGVMMETI